MARNSFFRRSWSCSSYSSALSSAIAARPARSIANVRVSDRRLVPMVRDPTTRCRRFDRAPQWQNHQRIDLQAAGKLEFFHRRRWVPGVCHRRRTAGDKRLAYPARHDAIDRVAPPFTFDGRPRFHAQRLLGQRYRPCRFGPRVDTPPLGSVIAPTSARTEREARQFAHRRISRATRKPTLARARKADRWLARSAAVRAARSSASARFPPGACFAAPINTDRQKP